MSVLGATDKNRPSSSPPGAKMSKPASGDRDRRVPDIDPLDYLTFGHPGEGSCYMSPLRNRPLFSYVGAREDRQAKGKVWLQDTATALSARGRFLLC